MKYFMLIAAISLMTFFIACNNEKEPDTQSTQEQQQMMPAHEGHTMADSTSMDMVVDPVCDMKISKSDAYASVDYNGKTYYFCMEADKIAFEKDPGNYVKSDAEN
jgi:Cu+-exporting ATPase